MIASGYGDKKASEVGHRKEQRAGEEEEIRGLIVLRKSWTMDSRCVSGKRARSLSSRARSAQSEMSVIGS